MKKNWPADQVERRSVADLVPYAKNSRTHSDRQIDQIAASINEWGWTVPVLVDEDGGIIAGHGRILAAQKLGIKDVPCMVAAGWSDEQKRAYVIADNKLTLNGGWDDNILAEELKAIGDAGFSLDLTGFGDDELSILLADKTDGLTDPDDVPDAPETPVTVRGDIWVCGNHRLLCGDSTVETDVAALMSGASADLCFTSPPYAQQRDYGAAKEQIGDWDKLMQGVFHVLPMKPAGQVLVNLGLVHRDGEWIPYWDGWIEWMREQGWRRFGWYVWDQGPGLPGDWNGRLAPSHEFVFHFNKETRRANKFLNKKPENLKDKTGDSGLRGKDGKISARTNGKASLQPTKVADSVIRVNRHAGAVPGGKHPAVFSVAFAEFIQNCYTKEGDVVFEPFCGSGTQIIAAEKMARYCYAIDIDPAYCDVAVRRWQAFTGASAVLEGDGHTFDEIAAQRNPVAA